MWGLQTTWKDVCMSITLGILYLPKREYHGHWFFLNPLTLLKTPDMKNDELKSVKAEDTSKIM